MQVVGKDGRGSKTGGLVPYGYAADSQGRLITDLAERKIIDRIKSLRVAGESTRAITRRLGEEGFTTRKGTPFTQNQVVRILKAAA